MPIQTLDEIMRTYRETRPDKIAMRAGERTWTYAEMDAESSRVAQALLAEGVGPQERVAFLDRNVPEYFGYLFGAAKINAVTLAVNWRLAAPEMEYILNHAESQILLIGEEFLEHLAKMKLETVKRVIVIRAPADGSGKDLENDLDRSVDYDTWIAGHEATDPAVPCDVEDVCYQLYTSGTTGLPKGVELTHRNLMTSMEVGGREWLIDGDTVNMVAMPLFHIAGSGWGIAGFSLGAESVLVRDMDPPEVLRLIEVHSVTNTLFVPAVLQILCATPGVENVDLSSLRAIVYGASPISEEVLVRSMKVFGCGFIQVYGLTETSGAVTSMASEDHDPGGPKAHLLRAAGKPWGDVRIRIVGEETMKDLPDGEVGEIWCASAQNMKGYWRSQEATDEAYPEGRDERGIGFFRTGDAGYMKDGYLFIHDRVKDMIVSGAENIYPAEIENVLMGHPAVADAAVIGVPSEKWGETVMAILVDDPSGAADDAELIAYCRERLAHFKCPTSVDRVAALPRNPSGKILKTELREPYWRGRTRRVN
jgi:acyl-CoA synthetase (AMP-forming)/AMP-acid ligase II